MARTSKKQKLKDQALEYLRKCVQSNVELVESQRKGLKDYMSEPYGNEIKGRSQVVMSDVADTIEWVMPSLMKIFFGGSQVVTIKPQGKEDEEKARLMEEKVNFDFQRGMNGYTLLYDWFKDAMIGKYGVVKYWWDVKEVRRKKSYNELSEAEFLELDENPDFIIGEVESVEIQPEMLDIMGNVIVPSVSVYNVTGTMIEKVSKPMAACLRPEEFFFDLRTQDSLKTTGFCAHKKKVHRNSLKKYKLSDREISDTVEAFDTSNSLEEDRYKDLGGRNFVICDDDENFVYIYECYMDDYDEDGNSIRKKVLIFGDKVLSIEDNTYEEPPFCGLTAIRIPHRAAGRSLAEIVSELQKLRTALIRALLDNMYYQNNGIDIVNPYRINMDDVVNRNEPGAKWRTLYDVEPSTVIHSKNPMPLPPQAFALLDTVENIKEKRTGVTSYNQGLDSKSLNKTATGISQIMGAAQQRMELIARMFAETGVKELFQAFVNMNLMFFDKETSMKLNEEWVNITPDMIDGKFDVIIDVGVGTGATEIQINQLINMINVSQPGFQMGVVQPKNYYNMMRQIYELMGYKNPDKFVSDPTLPENQQGNPQQQQLQMQMQQMEQVIKELQQKLEIAKSKTEVEMAKIALEEARLKLEALKFRMEHEQKERFKAVDVFTNEVRGFNGD